MRHRLWWLLPIFHVGLGLILGFWGSSQLKAGFGRGHIIDYVAYPEFILHLINLPMAIVVSIIAGKGNFQIGPEYSAGWFVVYLILIALFWSLIGLHLSKGEGFFPLSSKAGKMERLCGVFFGVLVLLMGVLLIHNPLGYFVSLIAFLWGISLIILFRHGGSALRAV
jgi:hypothetical protein